MGGWRLGLGDYTRPHLTSTDNLDRCIQTLGHFPNSTVSFLQHNVLAVRSVFRLFSSLSFKFSVLSFHSFYSSIRKREK